ncbi:MAG: hypothetical protein IJ744_10165 [Lachnospiraceae bacterium]|nr:hypothetical protein [Lachnospiraceae bacterium]
MAGKIAFMILTPIVLACGVLLGYLDREARERGEARPDYVDERQILIQGKAYKYCFALVFVYTVLYPFACLFWPVLQTQAISWFIAGWFAVYLFFQIYCIWKDAMFINSDHRKSGLNGHLWSGIFFIALVYFQDGLNLEHWFIVLLIILHAILFLNILAKILVDRTRDAGD